MTFTIVLQFCGHVKSCLRAEDPTTKKPKGFGFYEFESAEGSLRAIRLLTKLTIDGQELLVIMDLSSQLLIMFLFIQAEAVLLVTNISTKLSLNVFLIFYLKWLLGEC